VSVTMSFAKKWRFLFNQNACVFILFLRHCSVDVIQILVKDLVRTKSCTSILDPHMKTFDSV